MWRLSPPDPKDPTKMTLQLPQLHGDSPFLTDGGLETTLVFHEGIDLPHFAAFVLLKDEKGRAVLRRYYERYLEIAATERLGFVLESATWRASPDWAERLGMTPGELELYNRDAIQLLLDLRAAWKGRVPRIVVSGCVGPRGDGYDPGEVMTVQEARGYHAPQIETYAAAGADMICAITMTNIPEAIGVVCDAPERWRGSLDAVLGPLGGADFDHGAPAPFQGLFQQRGKHRFERAQWMPGQTWQHAMASLEGSSYLKLNRVLRWFTGNIGIHHVHHLSATIPFYRLPEVYKAIPELQNARTTSLHPKEIIACFRLKVWDPELNRMVGFKEIRAAKRAPSAIKAKA